MHFASLSLAALDWLGRQGTRGVAALVLIGIAVPPLGAVLKDFLTPAIFLLLVTAFLRVDTGALHSCLRRPGVIVAATAWSAVILPFIFGCVAAWSGFADAAPELFLGLMLQLITSPVMSAPAFAALMGLDATLVLVILLTSSAVMPLTAAVFVHLFIGADLPFAPLELGLRLFLLTAGAAAVGLALRRWFGPAAIVRAKERIDGLNILILFVFVAAIMEPVGRRFIEAPLQTVGLTLLAFAVAFGLLALTALLFRAVGREQALALGFLTSQRNMGLMIAATGGAVPELTWLYFALAQFPIYLFPQLLRPVVQRAREATVLAAPEEMR